MSGNFIRYTLIFTGILFIAYGAMAINNNKHVSFAQQEQNFTISPSYQHFLPLSSGEGNQVKVNITYVAPDSSYLDQRLNAVMGVYAPNSTLIKTSSFPNGFLVNSTEDEIQLATTLTDPSLNQVNAQVILTDLSKINHISNIIRVDLTLSENTATTAISEDESATIPEESASETAIEDEAISEEELEIFFE